MNKGNFAKGLHVQVYGRFSSCSMDEKLLSTVMSKLLSVVKLKWFLCAKDYCLCFPDWFIVTICKGMDNLHGNGVIDLFFYPISLIRSSVSLLKLRHNCCFHFHDLR